jgi:hypothetical protein
MCRKDYALGSKQNIAVMLGDHGYGTNFGILKATPFGFPLSSTTTTTKP